MNQFDLAGDGRRTDDVDIALHKFTQAALLRAFRTINTIHLDTLHRQGEFIFVVGIIAAQRKRQVIAQTHIGQLMLVTGGDGGSQFIPTLHDFENQIEVLSSIAFVQIFNIFDGGCRDALKSTVLIRLQDDVLQIVAQSDLFGKIVVGSLYAVDLHEMIHPLRKRQKTVFFLPIVSHLAGQCKGAYSASVIVV